MLNLKKFLKLPTYTHTASCILSAYPTYYEYQINIIDGLKFDITSCKVYERNGFLYLKLPVCKVPEDSKIILKDRDEWREWRKRDKRVK